MKKLLIAAVCLCLGMVALYKEAYTAPNGANIGSVPVSTSALASNLVVRSSCPISQCVLTAFVVSADSTLSGAAWWVMIFNATSAPGDGAVTPTKCYAVASGTPSINVTYDMPPIFTTGITIVASTTGCFSKTASAHAFISGDTQ